MEGKRWRYRMDDCGRNIRKNEDGKKNWEIVMVNSRERYSDE